MDHHIHDLALQYYESLDSARALTCAILLRSGEYDQLVNQSVDPHLYQEADSFFRDYAAIEFLRKCDGLPTTFDTEARAKESWWAAEKQCFKTNRFITDVTEGEKPSAQFIELFESLRKILHSALGRVPAQFDYRFGPGTTYARRGSRALIPDKLSAVPEMTDQAWVFLRELRDTAWLRCLEDRPFEHHHFSIDIPIVRGNRFTTVPKDSRTDRPIAVEPTFNLFIQLGIGSAIKRSLARLGLLRDDSQELHRKLAKASSLDGSLATIDLSSASDTVAYSLVKSMLPDSWFELMNASRSPFTQIDNKWVKLEKFSSMGNGYTFELETAIFYAICKKVAESHNIDLIVGHNFSVYGDDIIVPLSIAHDVTLLLRTLGFSLNQRKTYLTSAFRESCGGDFFYGKSVRPVQLKDFPVNPADWIVFHNQLVARNPYSQRLREWVLQQLPSSIRKLGGPSRLGDICLHGLPGICKWRDSIRYLKVYIPVASVIPLKRWDVYTGLASVLYGVSSDGVAPRDSISGYRTTWVTDS